MHVRMLCYEIRLKKSKAISYKIQNEIETFAPIITLYTTSYHQNVNILLHSTQMPYQHSPHPYIAKGRMQCNVQNKGN